MKIQNQFLTAIVAIFISQVFTANAQANLVINELANGNGSISNSFDPDEAIEFLLTTDYTAAELNGLGFGDSTGSTADKFSQFALGDLSSIATTFRAGTLLVLGGDNFTENTTYNPAAGGSDDDWSITLNAAGSFFSTVASSDGNFQIGGSGDVVWVDFNNTGDSDFAVDHAVGWDTGSDGAFLTSGGNVVNAGFNSSVGTGDFIVFTGGAGDILDPASFIDNGPSGSIGSPNGGDNTTYINSLRAVAIPEPSAFFFGTLVCGVLGWTNARKRDRS